MVSPIYSFCEPGFLPDDGRNRQPKHEVQLNKNQYSRSIGLCCLEW